jgi:hypothetical protein
MTDATANYYPHDNAGSGHGSRFMAAGGRDTEAAIGGGGGSDTNNHTNYSGSGGDYARSNAPRAQLEGGAGAGATKVEKPAFGGEAQPGVQRQTEQHRKFANPAPLGLSAFALTTFVLSLINMHARDVTAPNIVVALAFGYGGLVQLLAGMW